MIKLTMAIKTNCTALATFFSRRMYKGSSGLMGMVNRIGSVRRRRLSLSALVCGNSSVWQCEHWVMSWSNITQFPHDLHRTCLRFCTMQRYLAGDTTQELCPKNCRSGNLPLTSKSLAHNQFSVRRSGFVFNPHQVYAVFKWNRTDDFSLALDRSTVQNLPCNIGNA